MRWLVHLLLIALVGFAATPAKAIVDPDVAGVIAVPGGRIWYRINGTAHFAAGKTALLVLHGGPGGTHRSRLPLLDLADERPVILYDQLDSGHADHPGDPANWTLARFVAEIDAIRAHLGLSAVIVLGHSWGGSIAAAYGARAPQGLKALILSSPLISTPRWIADNAAHVAALPEETRRAIARHEAAGTTDSADYLAAVEVFNKRHLCRADPCPMGDAGNDAPAFNRVIYKAMWGPSEFTATGSLKDLDLTPRLGGITAPTLYLCGTYDEAPPATCRDFARLSPNAAFVEVPETGHATMFEARAFYIQAVRVFLKGLD